MRPVVATGLTMSCQGKLQLRHQTESTAISEVDFEYSVPDKSKYEIKPSWRGSSVSQFCFILGKIDTDGNSRSTVASFVCLELTH